MYQYYFFKKFDASLCIKDIKSTFNIRTQGVILSHFDPRLIFPVTLGFGIKDVNFSMRVTTKW